MIFKEIVKWKKMNPKNLFLVDGFGAILSTILLGIVLVEFESVFGIPRQTLYFLAAMLCLFAFYDFYCFFKIDNNLSWFLKGIATANLIYCCLSIILGLYHRNAITNLGWIYIFIEIVVVCILSIIELRVASAIEGQQLSLD